MTTADTTITSPGFSLFEGHTLAADGSLPAVASALQKIQKKSDATLLAFDNATGRTIDIDTRGSVADLKARIALIEQVTPADDPLEEAETESSAAVDVRGRGRPKLGVVSKEVTLLPRHWEWLGNQSGGASVALRKLVEDARRAGADKDSMKRRHERAYHFITAIAGNMPEFDEANRALFANDKSRFEQMTASWPVDVRTHAVALAFETAAPELV